MANSIDPLANLIQQFPIQCLSAVTALSLFCVWLIAFWRQERRLTAMQMQLDELRCNVCRFEEDYGGLLARFLNLSGSSNSLKFTNRHW